MKEKLKEKRGITLIALIITVLIMLILAGVAISALTTDENLFSKTQSAVEKYNDAVKAQDEKIASLINEMDSYFNIYSNGETIEDDETEKEPIATVVQVGDFVNYDAGNWTEEDMTKITSSSGNPTVNNSTAKPTAQGQFGGFTVG